MLRSPDYFPSRINMRVPNKSYDSAIHRGPIAIDIGTPAAGTATGITSNSTFGTGGGTVTLATPVTAVEKYGRCVQIKGDTAGDNGVITVIGFDFTGQPMRENITANGTSAVNGIKAFKIVTGFITGVNANASTFDAGWNNTFGLPFRTRGVVAYYENGVVATAGTFTAPGADTQTATTGDPKGRIAFNSTPNGSITMKALLTPDETNLDGVAHFAG